MLLVLLALVAPLAIGFVAYDFFTDDDDDDAQDPQDADVTRLDGTSVGDLLEGGSGSDQISGLAGSDTIFGRGGDDTLDGGLGNDELTGGRGDDVLLAGEGEDILFGSAGDDILVAEGTANASASDSFAEDQLFGGEGDDLLISGELFNIMDGGEGDDRLEGFAGEFREMSGGPGADVLISGGFGITDMYSGDPLSGDGYPVADDTPGDVLSAGSDSARLTFGAGDFADGRDGGFNDFRVSDEFIPEHGPAEIRGYSNPFGDRLLIYYDPIRYAPSPEITFEPRADDDGFDIQLDGTTIVRFFPSEADPTLPETIRAIPIS